MSIDAKKEATRFIKKYKFFHPNLNALKRIIESQGFVIVEFNGISDDANVTNILKSLNLTGQARGSRAFTYVGGDLRLVFVNEDLSDEEKLIVLLHEEGHIFCEHFSSENIIGRDVMQEKEANEFSHYVLVPSVKSRMSKHKVALIASLVAVCVLVIIVSIVGVVNKHNSYYGEYYLTESGTKYHKEDCIHIKNKNNAKRLTKDDYNSGEYSPCQLCLPE